MKIKRFFFLAHSDREKNPNSALRRLNWAGQIRRSVFTELNSYAESKEVGQNENFRALCDYEYAPIISVSLLCFPFLDPKKKRKYIPSYNKNCARFVGSQADATYISVPLLTYWTEPNLHYRT